MKIENELQRIIKDLNNINKFIKNNQWLQYFMENPNDEKIKTKKIKTKTLGHEENYFKNRRMNNLAQFDLDSI